MDSMSTDYEGTKLNFGTRFVIEIPDRDRLTKLNDSYVVFTVLRPNVHNPFSDFQKLLNILKPTHLIRLNTEREYLGG